MTADGPKNRPYQGKSAHRPQLAGDRIIAGLAEEQRGLVTLDQLLDRGLSAEAVHTRAIAGRLHRIHQGVYAVGHPLLDEEGRWLAGVLACGPSAVLSHRSAAALWGLRADRRGRIDVTAPGRRGRSPAGIDAHRNGALSSEETTSHLGIRCTTVSRTLLDLAGVVSPRELSYAVVRAEILRLLDLEAVRAVIDRGRGRRGVARLRRALEDYDPRLERARRELERRFLALCRRAGLPSPDVNVPLVLPDGPIEADFLWKEARLIVETDGRQTHGTASAFEADRRRDQQLVGDGWRVIRCTWRQVTESPEALVRTLRVLLIPR